MALQLHVSRDRHSQELSQLNSCSEGGGIRVNADDATLEVVYSSKIYNVRT